jgi:hypothetical protein
VDEPRISYNYTLTAARRIPMLAQGPTPHPSLPVVPLEDFDIARDMVLAIEDEVGRGRRGVMVFVTMGMKVIRVERQSRDAKF